MLCRSPPKAPARFTEVPQPTTATDTDKISEITHLALESVPQKTPIAKKDLILSVGKRQFTPSQALPNVPVIPKDTLDVINHITPGTPKRKQPKNRHILAARALCTLTNFYSVTAYSELQWIRAITTHLIESRIVVTFTALILLLVVWTFVTRSARTHF